MMSCIAIVAVLTLLLVAVTTGETSPQSNIRLVNNGYEGVVIAIKAPASMSDSECEQAITQIKVGIH